MFYNYVLQSQKSHHLYIGYANNLRKRLREHNNGLSQSSKSGVPWKLIYYEACLNLKDAKRRENYLKTTQGQRLSKRRLKEYFYETN